MTIFTFTIAARTLALRTPIDASQVRLGASHWRKAPETERKPEPASQLGGPPSLTIVSGGRKRSGKYG